MLKYLKVQKGLNLFDFSYLQFDVKRAIILISHLRIEKYNLILQSHRVKMKKENKTI